MRDLEAVVDAVGLERFPLLGISQGGPVAIAYAVRNPERVSHLVLLGSYAQGRRARATTPEDHELVDARHPDDAGWRGGGPTRSTGRCSCPASCPRARRRSGGSSTSSSSARRRRRTRGGSCGSSATSTSGTLATRVRAPTLIACARREPENTFEQSRLLATLIPGSRLLPLDSCNHLLPERDPAWPAFLLELDRFLAAPASPAATE